MSLLTDLQAISKNTGPDHYGSWLAKCNEAFQKNYPTDDDAKATLDILRQVWPDLSESDVMVLLETLVVTNSDHPHGTKAFTNSEVRVALNATYKDPKIQLSIAAKLPGDTPTAGPRWQNTDVVVEPGFQVDIKYVSGKWTANPQTGMVDADGNSSYKAKEGYTLPGENEGALVGRVVNNQGASPVFLVGKSCTVPTNLSGYLELGINDDLSGEFGDGFADNEGELLVELNSVNGIPATLSSNV